MTLPPGAVAAARYAYGAHRFEPFKVGFHPEVPTADLVGAYAHALTTIPCLAHGDWYCKIVEPFNDDVGGDPTIGPTMRLVEWDVPTGRNRNFGPFPWRYPDGAICYPKRGAAWVWHPEYEAALRIWGPKPFVVHDAWSFVPSCDHRPWQPILALLPARREFPGLKKMLNSIPGKLAQSRPRPGPFFDPMMTGLTTSVTRARMLEALAAAGDSVIGCVADALWTTKPIDLGPATGEPGSWKYGRHSDVLFVQSGLAFGDPDDNHPWGQGLASQGTPATALDRYAQEFRQAWDADGINAALEVEYRHFVGIAEAIAANLPSVGYWIDARHWVRFNPLRKRDEGRTVASGESFYVTTTAPLGADPAYFYLRGEPPDMIGDNYLSAAYWNEAWEPCGDPVDDLWPTDQDALT
jgi:hypothetical protein